MAAEMRQTQEEAWMLLYRQIVRLLAPYGRNGYKHQDDYFVVDENLGGFQQKVEIENLQMLRPDVIKSLQHLLEMFPRWEIVVGLSVQDATGMSRNMGLTIRHHEVIDGLQRQYFPEPYRSFRYEGSRPGTEND